MFPLQYCVVDKERGELMIQEQSLPQPRKLENLMLCNTRACKPEFIDRNFCFRVSESDTACMQCMCMYICNLYILNVCMHDLCR